MLTACAGGRWAPLGFRKGSEEVPRCDAEARGQSEVTQSLHALLFGVKLLQALHHEILRAVPGLSRSLQSVCLRFMNSALKDPKCVSLYL